MGCPCCAPAMHPEDYCVGSGKHCSDDSDIIVIASGSEVEIEHQLEISYPTSNFVSESTKVCILGPEEYTDPPWPLVITHKVIATVTLEDLSTYCPSPCGKFTVVARDNNGECGYYGEETHRHLAHNDTHYTTFTEVSSCNMYSCCRFFFAYSTISVSCDTCS